MSAERSWRPTSIADIAERASEGQPFDPLVLEFLDEFYAGSLGDRATAIADAPRRLSPLKDAYLAGVSEHMARLYELEIPAWVEAPERFLAQPFFAGGMEGMKALLLVESPSAFRRRLIFISRNALDRPRRQSAGARD